MKQQRTPNSHTSNTIVPSLSQLNSEPNDVYQQVTEKELLLNFLATWKQRDLTDQQAVDQLNTLTAIATPASSAQDAHQMQMELITYANNIVEKIIDSKAASYNHTLQFINPHQIYS